MTCLLCHARAGQMVETPLKVTNVPYVKEVCASSDNTKQASWAPLARPF